MHRRLITIDGSNYHFADYELPEPGPLDVRVQVEFASPKHGTEAQMSTGSAFDRKLWDAELRLFLPRPEAPPGSPPARYRAEHWVGNEVVGRVVACGSEVSRFQIGDRVFGYSSICEVHQMPEAGWHHLGEMAPEDAVCSDPAHVALVAVRDGNVRIGDNVAVFGLGAIGLLTVQIARASGARQVFATDPLPARREFALAHGATAAFDPATVDAALQIKLATDKAGADIAIETSGNGRALHEAIRCLRPCGTVVHVPWGPKDASALHLDEEFHLNRPTIIGSQAVWDNPDRAHPLWTEARARATAIDLLRAGTITGQGLITPIIDFEDAPAALPGLMRNPETAIKVGVRVRTETDNV